MVLFFPTKKLNRQIHLEAGQILLYNEHTYKKGGIP